MFAGVIEKLYHAKARVDKIIHIGASLADDESSPSDSLLDFIAYDLVFDLSGEIFPVKTPYELGETVQDGDIIEWLIEKRFLGFLISIETPIIDLKDVHFDQSSVSYRSSWASYQKQWFYGDTFEQAVDRGVAWAKSYQQERIEQARKLLEEATKGE